MCGSAKYHTCLKAGSVDHGLSMSDAISPNEDSLGRLRAKDPVRFEMLFRFLVATLYGNSGAIRSVFIRANKTLEKQVRCQISCRECLK